jgi:hypothetical protein
VPGLEKATITNTVTGERTEVQFNPEEYTLNRQMNFAQIAVPGRGSPLVQFVHGEARTLEMELFLDTYEARTAGAGTRANRAGDDVRELVRRVVGLMEIEPSKHAPPPLLFTWGSLSLTCVLARASQRFVLFLEDGTPVRARIQATFTEFTELEDEAEEVKRETADHTSTHLVSEGQTLASVAALAYGDARMWRPIAIANRLLDVRVLAPGGRLAIPRLPFRDPTSGILYQLEAA